MVDSVRWHQDLESTVGCGAARAGMGIDQHARRCLPLPAALVFAPAVSAGFATVSHYLALKAVLLGLRVGRSLERKQQAVQHSNSAT